MSKKQWPILYSKLQYKTGHYFLDIQYDDLSPRTLSHAFWPRFECLPTVCPGSSDPPEDIYNIFASENEVYTNYYNYYNTLGWILFV